jgi:hypothetical protein
MHTLFYQSPETLGVNVALDMMNHRLGGEAKALVVDLEPQVGTEAETSRIADALRHVLVDYGGDGAREFIGATEARLGEDVIATRVRDRR